MKISIMFFSPKFTLNWNKKKLFNEINMRYKYLLDKFTKDQIFNAGVAVTGLKFIKKLILMTLNEKTVRKFLKTVPKKLFFAKDVLFLTNGQE